MNNPTKVVLIWEPEWRHDFNVFPAKFWIFKFFFLMIFAIKMLLDNIYGLLNLFEFKINHFNSLVQAKSEFKNSNFGGKYIEIMSSLMFSNKYDFSRRLVFSVCTCHFGIEFQTFYRIAQDGTKLPLAHVS